ncbi:MAG: hypothetical protein GEV05_22125 [Betaproteobacteria bacterium]|nr:hypothetical protein [Betaproteobacteria bacterium]
MDRGIWAIWYDVANEHRSEYLAWFHGTHIPEKLSRPGYVWTVGSYKHAILHEFTSLDLREQHFGPHESQAHDPMTWMGRVRPQLTHASYSPAVGWRIWPASGA